MAKPDGRYSLVEAGPSDADLAKAIRGGGVTIPTAVILALITALASVFGTYFTTHATPVDCASKSDVNALDKHVSELSAGVKDLTVTIARNADSAHNETQNIAVELHSYINSHAK